MIRTANDRSRLTRRKTRSNPTLPSTTPTGLSGDPTRASSVRCRPPSRTNVCQFLSPPHKRPQQRITSEHPCVTALATSRLTYSALPLKLTGPQLVKTFVLFYGTRKLNNVFTTANIYTTSCARRIQFNPSDYISFNVCIFSQGKTQLTAIQNQSVLTSLKSLCGWHAFGQAGWIMPHDSSFSVFYVKHWITRTNAKSRTSNNIIIHLSDKCARISSSLVVPKHN